ncbi:MAG: heavy metal-responsive transcriptional regulator [Chthoniobacterales bacterium]
MTETKAAKPLSAGELARRAGVSTDTLRHYEAKGVLARPPRQANGYRSYPAETLGRVQLVRRALALGFTLDELAEILQLRDRGGAPCRKVRDLAATKLGSIEERLKELMALRDELRATLKDWGVRLAKTAQDQRSRLLENLTVPEAMQPRRRAPFTTTAMNKRKRKTK